jgi:multidrug efflux pump subunit AcrA (membrane-fusion protein)
MKKFYTVTLLVVVFALAISACANQQVATPDNNDSTPVVPANGTIAEGHLKPEHAVNLSFRSGGVVERINVKIGDQVKQGDVLAGLSNFEQATAQISAATLELTQAQQEYDTLQRTEGIGRADAWTAYMNAQVTRADAEREWEDLNIDDIEDRIEDAQTDIQDREDDLEDAQEELDKYKDLDEDNSRRKTAEDDLEAAQDDYNEAVRALEEITRERDTVRAALDAALATEAETKHTYEESLDGPNKEKLTLASSRLENAKAQVAAAEDALSNYQLTAPFDGVVAEVAVQVGEQVSPETRAVSIIDPSAWMVETTDVTELEVVDIGEGQRVTFAADALPDITMEGVVTEISQSSYTQSGDVLYTVRIKTNEVDPRVKWGMTVEVTFDDPEN